MIRQQTGDKSRQLFEPADLQTMRYAHSEYFADSESRALFAGVLGLSDNKPSFQDKLFFTLLPQYSFFVMHLSAPKVINMQPR